MKRYLVCAGNIGVGKSTLVSLLSERLGFRPYFEPVTENPYLEDFYADMGRWAFQSQLFFLSHRVLSHRALMDDPYSVVQDRSIYEDAEVFARNLFEQGALSRRDWETYRSLYTSLIGLLPAPDLVVYLKASLPTLRARIAKRMRGFESSIGDEYLLGLNRLYDAWIEGFRLAPVLVVDSDALDFVEEKRDFDAVIETIDSILRDKQASLFPQE
jgi:deoxyadenosine/deoxycytidine kinase